MNVETVSIRSLNNLKLQELSSKRYLSLSLDEMLSAQKYYKHARRNPTDLELETIAQTWSEHCKHKTFRSAIKFTYVASDGARKTTIYNNLLGETVFQATRDVKKPWVLSAFKDNAGVISFDNDFALAFKVETHNHPSALEPYGGAGTGIGGVIRDVMGCGLGAKPVLNTDVFCFAPLTNGETSVPEGIQLPRRIFSGVVEGVRDYGNRMGIPTANGAIFFHKGYLANPLVFCGTVGLLPRKYIAKTVRPGYLIVVIGGRTGRDGIHGATFSSAALHGSISSSVVQIGHAIMEKKTLDVLLAARDKGLYRAITDCGAGGLSSAVGELGADCGAAVDLEKAPLKYEGLAPWEIWLSESQERMVLAVAKNKWEDIAGLCAAENVEATVIGEFTGTKRLIVKYGRKIVGDLSMKFLHDGLPKTKREAVWREKSWESLRANVVAQFIERRSKTPDKSGNYTATTPDKSGNYNEPNKRHNAMLPRSDAGWASIPEAKVEDVLLRLLAHPNIASKEWVIRQYDHEVQGGSVVKPLVGKGEGPGDACVIRPRLGSWRGVAVGCGINPLYGAYDPYHMAALNIEEALRNVTAVGGNIEKTALLDNFCWGDVTDPEILGGLVRASQACYDIAKSLGVPFISGKDSLNNTYRDTHGKITSIPSTLLISAISVIEDVRKCVTADFKSAGNSIWIVGATVPDMLGSHYGLVTGKEWGALPRLDVELSCQTLLKLAKAIVKGIVLSCHDISEGGLAVAASEMALSGDIGLEIVLARVPLKDGAGGNEHAALFSESPSRFVVEVEERDCIKWEKLMKGIPVACIGRTVAKKVFTVAGFDGKKIIELPLTALARTWHKGLTKQL